MGADGRGARMSLDTAAMLGMYRTMLRIRLFEERVDVLMMHPAGDRLICAHRAHVLACCEGLERCCSAATRAGMNAFQASKLES